MRENIKNTRLKNKNSYELVNQRTKNRKSEIIPHLLKIQKTNGNDAFKILKVKHFQTKKSLQSLGTAFKH